MKNGKGIGLAILAAALYALSAPCSKLLLEKIPATLMAALLYLGAGIGMLMVHLLVKKRGARQEQRLTVRDLPYTAGMVLLDIAAPIFLMLGLSRTAAANVSLLNNFEIVATSLIAMLVFREPISRRLWLAIVLVTVSSGLLTWEGGEKPVLFRRVSSGPAGLHLLGR